MWSVGCSLCQLGKTMWNWYIYIYLHFKVPFTGPLFNPSNENQQFPDFRTFCDGMWALGRSLTPATGHGGSIPSHWERHHCCASRRSTSQEAVQIALAEKQMLAEYEGCWIFEYEGTCCIIIYIIPLGITLKGVVPWFCRGNWWGDYIYISFLLHICHFLLCFFSWDCHQMFLLSPTKNHFRSSRPSKSHTKGPVTPNVVATLKIRWCIKHLHGNACTTKQCQI